MSDERKLPESREAFKTFRTITTRWMDNDVYGHVNNVVYYSFFDTAVNQYLIEADALDFENGEIIGLVVETGCTYFSSVQFPQKIEAGIRVTHVGRSSVRYEVGIFSDDQIATSAVGYFVHVYVDRLSRKSVSLSATLRDSVERIMV